MILDKSRPRKRDKVKDIAVIFLVIGPWHWDIDSETQFKVDTLPCLLSVYVVVNSRCRYCVLVEVFRLADWHRHGRQSVTELRRCDHLKGQHHSVGRNNSQVSQLLKQPTCSAFYYYHTSSSYFLQSSSCWKTADGMGALRHRRPLLIVASLLNSV